MPTTTKGTTRITAGLDLHGSLVSFAPWTKYLDCMAVKTLHWFLRRTGCGLSRVRQELATPLTRLRIWSTAILRSRSSPTVEKNWLERAFVDNWDVFSRMRRGWEHWLVWQNSSNGPIRLISKSHRFIIAKSDSSSNRRWESLPNFATRKRQISCSYDERQ